MNHPFWHTCWRIFRLPALASLLLFNVSCHLTYMDRHYHPRMLKNARTDCTGTEIVGVWMAQMKWERRTLLLRPDGTGLLRLKNRALLVEPADIKALEYAVTWQYSGGGVWNGTLLQHANHPTPLKLRITGDELIWQLDGKAMDEILIFVNTANETAMTAYLNKR